MPVEKTPDENRRRMLEFIKKSKQQTEPVKKEAISATGARNLSGRPVDPNSRGVQGVGNAVTINQGKTPPPPPPKPKKKKPPLPHSESPQLEKKEETKRPPKPPPMDKERVLSSIQAQDPVQVDKNVKAMVDETAKLTGLKPDDPATRLTPQMLKVLGRVNKGEITTIVHSHFSLREVGISSDSFGYENIIDGELVDKYDKRKKLLFPQFTPLIDEMGSAMDEGVKHVFGMRPTDDGKYALYYQYQDKSKCDATGKRPGSVFRTALVVEDKSIMDELRKTPECAPLFFTAAARLSDKKHHALDHQFKDKNERRIDRVGITVSRRFRFTPEKDKIMSFDEKRTDVPEIDCRLYPMNKVGRDPSGKMKGKFAEKEKALKQKAETKKKRIEEKEGERRKQQEKQQRPWYKIW